MGQFATFAKAKTSLSSTIVTAYHVLMNEHGFTDYFENEVLRKRPYLRKDWCVRVVENPLKTEPQEHNRFRFRGSIDELEGRILA